MERGKVWRMRGCLKTCFFLSLFTQRIHLDVRIGEHDLDAAIARAKDKVNEVSFKLEHLIEQIEQIVKEQNYQRVSMPSQLIFTSSCREHNSPKPLNQGKKQPPVPGSSPLSLTVDRRYVGENSPSFCPLHPELL